MPENVNLCSSTVKTTAHDILVQSIVNKIELMRKMHIYVRYVRE